MLDKVNDSVLHFILMVVMAFLLFTCQSIYQFIAGNQEAFHSGTFGGVWFAVAGLFMAGVLLHVLKTVSAPAYGILEICVGVYLNYRTLSQVDFTRTTSTERLAILLGGVYLIKRGTDAILEHFNKEEPVKS